MSYSGRWRLPLAHETMPFGDGNVRQRSLGLPLVHVTVPFGMEMCGRGAKPGGMASTTLSGAIPAGGRSCCYQFHLGIDTRVCFRIDTSLSSSHITVFTRFNYAAAASVIK